MIYTVVGLYLDEADMAIAGVFEGGRQAVDEASHSRAHQRFAHHVQADTPEQAEHRLLAAFEAGELS